MDNQSPKWFFTVQGKTYGPYGEDEFRGLVAEGRATGDSKVCTVGSQEWIRLAEALPQLFAGALPPPPPEEHDPRPKRRRLGRGPADRSDVVDRDLLVSQVRVVYAASRSYVGAAFLTFVLYWVGFYVIGLISNLVYLSKARRDQQITGVAPEGKGCLLALLWTFFWIPILLGVIYLIALIFIPYPPGYLKTR